MNAYYIEGLLLNLGLALDKWIINGSMATVSTLQICFCPDRDGMLSGVTNSV